MPKVTYVYIAHNVKFTAKEMKIILRVAEGREKSLTVSCGSSITNCKPKMEKILGEKGIKFTQLCCKFAYSQNLLPLG